MSYICTTVAKLVSDLKELARGKSNYKNVFPYNLLYWNGARFFGDCSNTYKALFNNRDIHNKTVGSYAWPLPATGDATEWALYLQCSDRSSDFTKLKLGEPRLLYMEGHIGAYLGEEWNEPGQGIVNCVECTPAWEDGIQFSYVDKTGRRSWCKDAAARGYWEGHGLMSKWVEYAVVPPQPDPQPIAKHYGATDLAVYIIRGSVDGQPIGYGAKRIADLKILGYSEDEIRAAQNIVNRLVAKANSEKAELEYSVAITTAAYDVIAGKYGDGEARKKALIEEYGEQGYADIQFKVDSWLK